MSNQGTIRLKVTNDAPAIEKLWNGRFRLEFLCDNNSPKTDWYSENISSILPEFGILQDTNFGSGVSEDWEAIPDSVYPDMRLVETEYVFIPSMGDKRVKLTYETLTDSWVEEKDEDTDYELNGLKRVSRTFVALPDTAYDKVVGTSTIDSNGTTLYLGSFKIEETDAKWSLSESWLEAGELSREENSEDAKGSIGITQIGGCPAAPAGYTVVNESKNNTQGFETCSRTFYKDDSELSRSNDYVGSQLAESIEVFSPTSVPSPSNGSAVLGSKSTSNVDGIPTTRYTFLVPSVLSESSDRVGSQLAITVEAFNEVPPTPAGYILANTQASDVEGIVTNRYTFLKPSILSQSEDKVGSQLAITIEAFEETPATPADYVIANTRVSDVEGIPTTRYTFLKPSILSKSSDKIGSQLAITIEAFKEIPATPAGYVLANEQVSDFGGIKTNRYTFLKPSILSEASDKVGSQVSIVIEAFNLTPSTPVNYVLANTRISDVAGIPTKRYTFLKGDVELSRSEDKVGSQLAIVIEQFDGIPATPAGYSVANTQESEVEGIPTKRYTFLKPSVLSRTDVDDGSRMAIIIEAFEEVPSAIAGYALTNTQVSDVEGIPTNRYTFLKEGLLSESAKALSDGLTKKSYTWLGTASNESGVLVGETIGNYQGIQTITREYMVLPTGFGSSFDYESTVPFTIPGTVTTEKKDIGGGKNLILITTPPVQTTCVATVEVSYSTDSTPNTSGLYQPDSWSSAIVSGIGYNYRPISYTNTMSNYIRIGSGDTIIRTQGEGEAIPPQALMGQFLYINVEGRIELTGPTDDPAGDDLLLSVSVDPVFSSITGTQYYKTTKVTAKVPVRG